MRLARLVMGLACFNLAGLAMANNLGVYGALYTISEPDLLSAIQTTLHQMQLDGDLDRQKQAFIKNSIEHIIRPTPVAGVSDLGQGLPHQHDYDPSIRVDHDIIDTFGHVIAKAGTQINPLKLMNFDELLLFINADNFKQLKWVKKNKSKWMRQYHTLKIILTHGNVPQTSKFLKARIYFDQGGVLSHRFAIMHTPTLVYQPLVHGRRLDKLSIQECRYE